jgi:hypothetical protein
MSTVLTSLTALVASHTVPAMIKAIATGIVAVTAARSKCPVRRRDAQRTLRILVPQKPDREASSRGRKRTKEVRPPTSADK